MDNRLSTIGASRPGKIRKQDIPNLAAALVGYAKGLATLDVGSSRNVSYVRLHGKAFDVLVVGEDWAKILPYLQDGTLTAAILPSSQKGEVDPRVWQSGRDSGDPVLYTRVLTILSTIFADAESYPTQIVTPGFTPNTIPGLCASLDVSRSTSVSLVGSSVSVWKETTLGRNAYQTNVSARPTLVPNALNGLPGIAFDGTQWLDFPLQALSDWSVLIVGKFEFSATQTVGGFLVAAGYEGLGNGLDCYIKQNDSVGILPGPEGRLTTWLFGDLAPISPYNDAAEPDTFKLFSWIQQSQLQGGARARVGLNEDVDLATLVLTPPYDLSQERWDPTRQLAGNPAPLLGAIGRYSGTLASGPTFYLVGLICEILVYRRVLEPSEFNQLAMSLNVKWGGSLL